MKDLASVWLQEKVKAELAIALKQPPPNAFTPSPYILQKRAEQAELEKQAYEQWEAMFPMARPDEFKRRWTAFVQAGHLRTKPVHTVTVHTAHAEKDKTVEEIAARDKENNAPDAVATQQAKTSAYQQVLAAQRGAYWNAKREGKSNEEAIELAKAVACKLRDTQEPAHRPEEAAIDAEFAEEVDDTIPTY